MEMCVGGTKAWQKIKAVKLNAQKQLIHQFRQLEKNANKIKIETGYMEALEKEKRALAILQDIEKKFYAKPATSIEGLLMQQKELYWFLTGESCIEEAPQIFHTMEVGIKNLSFVQTA